MLKKESNTTKVKEEKLKELGKIIQFKSWIQCQYDDSERNVQLVEIFFCTELIEENTRVEPFRLLLKPGVSVDFVMDGLHKAMEIIQGNPSIFTEEYWDKNKSEIDRRGLIIL